MNCDTVTDTASTSPAARMAPSSAPIPAPATDPLLAPVHDFHAGSGWAEPARAGDRARWCCEQLEAGRILSFPELPYAFPAEDRQFLLGQRQGARVHKNISYRPKQDLLRGSDSETREDAERLRRIMRQYSARVTEFLGRVLTPYAAHWSLDYASFRPEEEKGRDLPLHKRNDLLHVDAFPSRPTRGNRILRCFTNINPAQGRVWLTTDGFAVLADKFARAAGLEQFARSNGDWLQPLQRLLGLKSARRSAYDRFMLRFHDYLKENGDFQRNCRRIQLEFPPLCTWLCYTDSVPHAVLSGQFALEQTFIIPVNALVAPQQSPLRVLERIAGRPLAPAA